MPSGVFLKSLGKNIPIRINAFSNKAVRGEARFWECFTEDNISIYRRRLEDAGL